MRSGEALGHPKQDELGLAASPLPREFTLKHNTHGPMLPLMSADSKPPDSIPPSTDERRKAARNVVCVPARVSPREGVDKLSLIEDISLTGARLLTRCEPEMGENLRLSLYLSGTNEAPTIVMARVVRLLPFDGAETLWRRRVAVVFEHPLHGCEQEIHSLAEEEAR